jgi:hypothetical protein
MTEQVSAEDIARVEARIEELAVSIERCKKIAVAAKVAIGGGALWLALTLVGLVEFVPAPFIAALAAMIGGAVLLGSNKTTWQQMETAMAASEALRTQMIERLALRPVNEAPRYLH